MLAGDGQADLVLIERGGFSETVGGKLLVVGQIGDDVRHVISP
jgi:hypothetical protein